MFSFIKKKDTKDSKTKELQEKIAKMNLTEMRSFVNKKDEITQQGLLEVIQRLLMQHGDSSKRFLEVDDADVKIKKAFDLVIMIAKSKKITIETVEMISNFIELYADLIEKYDKQNKDIYKNKLKDALALALANMEKITELKRKSAVID